MKTLAAVLEKINSPLSIEELTIPGLKLGQVLVKIAYSGICHTQLNEIRGLKGEDKYLPHTLGHEGSGIVKNIGPTVSKVKIGDHVVLTWIKGKGLDVPQTKYQKVDGTIINSGAISTFMEYVVISENRLVAINKKMPLKEAALLGCAIPTGAGIIINTIKLSKGETIAIFGMGGIGLSALLAAKFQKAAIIIAIDVFDNKLDYAIKLGATNIINAKKQDVLSEILKITNKCGVDYAVECAGKKESMEVAFKSVRDKNGICVVTGNLPQGESIAIDPFDLIKGKKIIGTWGGETQPDINIPIFVDWFLNGKIDFKKIISKCYKLAEINEALDSLCGGMPGRPLINMESR
jgi:S-(hydroxymethyl)glutathione dehydrogenase / alcohol dehydrogenase